MDEIVVDLQGVWKIFGDRSKEAMAAVKAEYWNDLPALSVSKTRRSRSSAAKFSASWDFRAPESRRWFATSIALSSRRRVSSTSWGAISPR
jgi:hypothetical protein